MENANVENKEIKDRIYMIRGQQVMLDFDLASLYGYEVRALNQQVKRNIERFPEDFMFQLTEKETLELSRSQFVTSIQTKGVKGGRSYKIFAFTEQGIYMLSTVLKGNLAINQSILIMRTFKEMRHYIKENQSLLNSNELLTLSNTVIQNKNDIIDIHKRMDNMATKSDINKIMDNFIDEDKIKDITILNGQKFEANEAYIKIYKQAKKSIYLIDDYINIDTLSLLKNKGTAVNVIIFSDNKGNGKRHLHELEINNFNEQYPSLSLRKNGICHDRYIILDYDTNNEMIYHCGASSKDAGKKVCGINQIMNTEVLHIMIDNLFLG